jgi:pyruvate,orthophosphate dikinase
MFMQKERLPAVQEMILASTTEERKAALDKLLPMQQGDFVGILKAMHGYSVTIRTLDPPLHEFLPDIEALTEEVKELRKAGPSAELEEKEAILAKTRQLHEANPMMGFRGTRLGVVYPEIYEMQVRAILGAAAELIKQGYDDIHPEIMIPLVGIAEELRLMKELVLKVEKEIREQTGVDVKYKFGTMIEVPRGALTADEIAVHAEFFSFGTNDLTQMTYGFSRDDAEGKFLKDYVDMKVIKYNPFQVLDPIGVGKLVRMAVELGRKTRPDLKIGICGEHGGDPESIHFCHDANLTYVSCSPFRVPVARLAAAQAALGKKYQD